MAPLMLRVTAAALLLASLSIAGQSATQEPDLYAQATAAMLDRRFPSRDVDYLLMNVRSHQVIAMRWPRAETPVPVGSLLKPFVALAFAGLNSSEGALNAKKKDPFPTVICHGKSDGCWRTGGHGSMHLERALAQSCNAYFLALARAITASGDGNRAADGALRRVSESYGLPAPPQMLDAAEMPGMLIGVTPEWRVQPFALAQAYALLATGHRDATTARLLAGMRLAASRQGTASRAGAYSSAVLAKTGTAACVPLTNAVQDRCRENGDGLVLLMFPAEAPTLLLLVRKHGTTGAMAAEVAGQMLVQIEEMHAAH